ncbi:hypothetical protein [Pseudoxanthomonas putridarboris]|uniref:Lipoprotein n=1 Tax=Pseudoxanthomonas putridarboris TaxID=752605 RepID=A0ABU9IW40_9GAMM
MGNLAKPVLWLVAAFAMAGCASVSSRLSTPAPRDNNGLVYSLPNRLIDVRVEFSGEGQHKLTVEGGSYYPDAADESRYVARIHKGKVGTIKATLATSGGLLTSADAKYTGQSAELAKAIGAAAGVVGSRSHGVVTDAAECKRTLTVTRSLPLSEFTDYKAEFNPLDGDPACANVSLEVKRIDGSPRSPPSSTPTAGKRANGLWYRVELPYLVTAKLGDSAIATALVMLPDESPRYFVGMDAGIFADADNKMVFTNGMLTSYEKSNDSEVIALFKLPAAIISAYASAVGDIFSNFSTAEKHEVNAEIARINRELVLQKIESCNHAISQKQPADVVKELCTIPPLP